MSVIATKKMNLPAIRKSSGFIGHAAVAAKNSDLPVTQNVQLDALANRGTSSAKYDASAVINRLTRQADNEGSRARLLELLQDELHSLAAKYNKLLK